ncbi:ROK family protein [Ornithobacterium rhinotracheale]|uniref:ROK family protein n=1 Tax=Ornithobacterium rhinotracheale TaxID=28251 RepID=UPI00129C512A|nr:ROK family protein [Ornithobacterium rhinotracheale]MRJ07855.1 ROK family protein [Ornithobacterium rhinotracheale]UOH78630.1 ROK family protein [Ornithobacterium rhinotracheale]
MSKKYALGVDVGGSHISCCAVDMDTQKLVKESFKREKLSHTDTKENILKTWAKAINECMESVGVGNVLGLGFAMPGPFNYKEGISMLEHKYPNLYKTHIPTALNEYLIQKQEMRFLNDASAFAVGVAWIGKGKGKEKVVVITLGTGFGSAYIDGGVPIVEREDVAPEGCLWHLKFKDGIADEYFSTRWFTGEYEKRTGKAIQGVKDVIDTPLKDELFTEFGENLGNFMAPWLNKFNADILVMGGNISLAYPHFEKALLETLKQNGNQTPVAVSELMEDAAMIGAARTFDETYWAKVKDNLPKF